jgi:hypothetical protein
LQGRVNGYLALAFSDVALTSYAGLELFGRYLRRTRFNALGREIFRGTATWGDYGVVAMIRLLGGLLVVGGRRLRHVAYVADDPLVRRFTGLRQLPTARTVSRWLKQFTMMTVERLQDLNAGGVARVLPALGLGTITIAVDGVVVSTGLQVERAFRRFNPHHRKVPSYYPTLAHVAETTHILRVKNRSGNVHDGKASLPFLRELWTQVMATLGRRGGVRFRMDGAFFREDVLRWLHGRPVAYAIQGPFYTWLDLQTAIRRQRRWMRVTQDVSGFALAEAITPWGFPIVVTIYRKPVRHRTAKNFQLDLFDPNAGYSEYSAVASNLPLTVRNLWFFMAGRGNQEKTIGQLKSGLAFHTVPTSAYAAHSAWQQVVALTHHLLTNFQIDAGADARARSRKHTVLHLLQSVQTLRFEVFHRAAMLVRPGGVTQLRLADNAATRHRFECIEKALARAA